ncbi:uncharacterized protein LOC122094754 [Macadamia integrifolia]|uniref:uncharacterized protein LOC122094754 n=1 Tax=Macadamia integrifolia TaxID=60698 RepID=UPI001C530624|nr:uncharacterized protein LOC122094754 [Macadamia integrifolia]
MEERRSEGDDMDNGDREALDRGPPPQGPEVNASTRSYARVVGLASWPAIDSLPEPIQAGNITRIVIPQNDYEAKRQNFRFALIGRVNFRLLSLDDLRQEARDNWKLNQGVVMHPLGKGYVIFQFRCEGDKAAIWRRTPLRVRGQLIRLQHWRPDFNIHEKNSFTKLVWVRFPDLPLEYWHDNVLLSIAKAVGRPVTLDNHTRQGILGYFARVLVEVDSSEAATRVEEVQVERFEPGTTKIFGFRQRVIYEDNCAKCGFCKRMGHQVNNCRLKKMEDEKQSARDNVRVPGAILKNKGELPIEEGNGSAGQSHNKISSQLPNIEEGVIQINLNPANTNLPILETVGFAQERAESEKDSSDDVEGSDSVSESDLESDSDQNSGSKESGPYQVRSSPVYDTVDTSQQEVSLARVSQGPVRMSSRTKRTGLIQGSSRGGLTSRGGRISSSGYGPAPTSTISRREIAVMGAQAVDRAVLLGEQGKTVGEKKGKKKKGGGQTSISDKIADSTS